MQYRMLLLVALATGYTAPAQAVTIAVLPLQPHIQASAKEAAWIERKLHRDLRSHKVTLIVGDPVQKAMAAVGAKDTLTCDTACLVAIGERLKADFVVAPDLSLQRKEQSVGTAWIWSNRQVNVQKKAAWGSFGQMCMCAVEAWDIISARVARDMLSFDPSKVVRLPDGAPRAQPTRGPRDEPGMVFVPAGPFIMGNDKGEGDETPKRVVDLSAFYMDTYEVTNAAYNKCVSAQKCMRQRYWADKTLNQPNHPVIGVGWIDGVNYCRFAGKRLPTEAEWEKTARGTDERIFPWGNEFDPMVVNMHNPKDGWPTTSPVGYFKKNVSPYGAYDMAGNAWEWTADYWHYLYYRKAPNKDPKGPVGGVKRVMRGGSWMYDVPFFVTSHNRSPGRPWIRKRYVGFRCAKSL